jgi:hypothetical protein
MAYVETLLRSRNSVGSETATKEREQVEEIDRQEQGISKVVCNQSY